MPRPTCPSCEKPIADDHEWEHIPPGEGVWLCWDHPTCINDPSGKPAPAPGARIMARLDALEARLDQLLTPNHP